MNLSKWILLVLFLSSKNVSSQIQLGLSASSTKYKSILPKLNIDECELSNTNLQVGYQKKHKKLILQVNYSNSLSFSSFNRVIPAIVMDRNMFSAGIGYSMELTKKDNMDFIFGCQRIGQSLYSDWSNSTFQSLMLTTTNSELKLFTYDLFLLIQCKLFEIGGVPIISQTSLYSTIKSSNWNSVLHDNNKISERPFGYEIRIVSPIKFRTNNQNQ